jgi:hypothetical protein
MGDCKSYSRRIHCSRYLDQWTRRSVELANGPSYLDNLRSVYPVSSNPVRPISTLERQELQRLYERKDHAGLVRRLLRFEKFPIKDPYVAYLKRGHSAIELNPETVQRIAETLYSIGFERMIEGIQEPKEFNRQIGTLFRKFLPKLDYQIVGPGQIRDSNEGIFLLGGSDEELKEFARQYLDYDVDKGLDLVAKVDSKYIIGEAKFLTDFGGHQNAQFRDALALLKEYDGIATSIAILDGVVWIRGGHKMFRTVTAQDKSVLSALLLKQFLESLR